MQRIRRRRQAGELLCVLAHEHGVSSRNLRRRLKAADAAAAGAEPKRSGRQPKQASMVAPTNRPPRAQPPQAAASLPPRLEPHGLLPDGFSSWQQRLAHYEQRKLDSYTALLDYHDALRGRETPAERRARQAAAPLSSR